MEVELVNVGSEPNDRTGDTWRDAFIKVNAGLSDLYSNFGDDLLFINSEEDFPAQDSEKIIMETGKLYFIASSFETSKRFELQPGTAFRGLSQNITSITYTGTGTMFTGTSNVLIESTNVSCQNGTFIALSGPGPASILRGVRVESCSSIGSVSGSQLAIFQSGFLSASANGLSFSGIDNTFIMVESQINMTGGGGIGLNLGTATFSQFRIDEAAIFGGVGTTAISGMIDSGNINPGSFGGVTSSVLDAVGITPLEGIKSSDARWEFSATDGVTDSKNGTDFYLTVPETVTINTSGVFEHIGGVNWQATVSSRFTVSVDGVATYIGEKDISIQFAGLATVSKAGGGSDEIEVRVAKNWIPGDGGLIQTGAVTQNASFTSVPTVGLTTFTNGDTIRLIAANNSGVGDIDVSKASLIVLEG